MITMSMSLVFVLRGTQRRFSGGWNCLLGVPLVMVLVLARNVHAQALQFGYDPNGNLLTQTAEISTLPQILAQPQPQVVGPGDLASFLMVVADTRALTYQWRFNGSPLGGRTNDALLLTNVNIANEGLYSVVLSNSSGSVTSAPAMLWFDGDRDGLPDSWELAQFGSLTNTATGDFDGDGAANLNEFLDGTSPTNSASGRFRLTVLSDGGSVTVFPSQLSYTNGEVVTLTATAFAPYTFRGWTGATNTQTNPLILTMNTNKTLFARLGPADLVWTNTTGGDWNVASNWVPNLVPVAYDNVYITDPSTAPIISLNAPGQCHDLVLGGGPGSAPNLAGSGMLTINGEAVWVSGAMVGGGRTEIAPGATLKVVTPTALNLFNNRTLDNGGTIIWSGGDIFLVGTVITNRPGALFQVQNAAQFNGSLRFDNTGTLRKTAGGTTTFAGGAVLNNYGAVELQAGTLVLGSGGTQSGSFDVAAGTTLNLSGGTHTGTGSSSITGAGQLTVSASANATLAGLVNLSGTNLFSGGGCVANLTGNYICNNNSLVISGATVSFNGTGAITPAVLTLSSGTLGGGTDVTVGNQMYWTGGTMTGGGRTVIAPGATLMLANPVQIFPPINRTLDNGGTVLWTGAGEVSLGSAVITNRPGALFQVQNAATFLGYGSARFDNAGTLRKTAAGTTTFASGVALKNYGALEIRTGIIAASGGYTCSSDSLLNSGLGGTTAGTGYGQLLASGAVTLNGALSVDLLPGFSPATNDTFAVLTAGSRSGTFGSFTYPANRVTMAMSNTPTAVVLHVGEVLPVPQPALLALELTGPDIRLIWSAISNVTYRVEFNPDLSPSNWTALPGDITTLSNTASKLDALTLSNRFYRVRVLP